MGILCVLVPCCEFGNQRILGNIQAPHDLTCITQRREEAGGALGLCILQLLAEISIDQWFLTRHSRNQMLE